MGVKRSKLAVIPKRVEIVFEGDVIEVYYNRAVLTPKFQEDCNAVNQQVSEGQTGENEALIFTLINVLISWDVKEDDDSMTPIDRDSLRTLPLPFLAAILQKVSEDMRPNESSPATSECSS